MNYRVLIRRSAQKELGNLPAEIRQRIYSALMSLATNPRPHGCKKLQDREAWRVRIGNYRAVYEIDDHEKIAVVMRVAHRREVYQ